MKNYIMIALALGIVVAYFYGLQNGKSIGEATCQNRINAAVAEQQQIMKKQRKDSQEVIQKLEAKREAERRKANEALKEVLKLKTEVKKWWDTQVPDDITDFVYRS